MHRRWIDRKGVGAVDGHELDPIPVAVGHVGVAVPALFVHLRTLLIVALVVVLVGAIGTNGPLLAATLQKLVERAIVRVGHVLAPTIVVVVRNRIGPVEERTRRGHWRHRPRPVHHLEAPRRDGRRRRCVGSLGLPLLLRGHVALPALLVEEPDVAWGAARLGCAARVLHRVCVCACATSCLAKDGASGDLSVSCTRERRVRTHPHRRRLVPSSLAAHAHRLLSMPLRTREWRARSVVTHASTRAHAHAPCPSGKSQRRRRSRRKWRARRRRLPSSRSKRKSTTKTATTRRTAGSGVAPWRAARATATWRTAPATRHWCRAPTPRAT